MVCGEDDYVARLIMLTVCVCVRRTVWCGVWVSGVMLSAGETQSSSISRLAGRCSWPQHTTIDLSNTVLGEASLFIPKNRIRSPLQCPVLCWGIPASGRGCQGRGRRAGVGACCGGGRGRTCPGGRGAAVHTAVQQRSGPGRH